MTIIWVLIGFAAGVGCGIRLTMAHYENRALRKAILDERQGRRDGYLGAERSGREER